jgi:hypothetical protein
MLGRRNFLKISALSGSGVLLGNINPFPLKRGNSRSFALCTNTKTLNSFPEFMDLISGSGINQVWMPLFINGYWPYPVEDILLWKERFEKKGISVNIVNVPFGHPAGSLGDSQNYDITPASWPRRVDLEGKKYSGTSVHPSVTQENIRVIQKVEKSGFGKLFLDDDFRLAAAPGTIGGCFCDDHQKEFLGRFGYAQKDWEELKHAISNRDLIPILRNWITFNCDQLTGSFKAQQDAAPHVKLGIMVMYLGSEKAGIRLGDYKETLMRVGEFMFSDDNFSPVKGKTDELFSSLFHRRFVKPEMAFSETTAYPANKLSAGNMAAKLHISTISDVRNTMMMSGLDPFPFSHWSTLAPAMVKAAAMHEKLAGQKLQGPFKHYWGERSRMVGDDNPYSLFLASGIPFEVTDTPASDGWTFLSGFDIQDVTAGNLKSGGTKFIYGSSEDIKPGDARFIPEKMDDIFAFKHEVIPLLKGVPYVMEDKPVVCAWYPGIKTVLLWNLSESRESFTVKLDNKTTAIEVKGLDAELIRLDS